MFKRLLIWISLFLVGGCAAAGTVLSASSSEELAYPGLRFWALLTSAGASGLGLALTAYQVFLAPKPQTEEQASKDKAEIIKETRKAGDAAVMSGVSTRQHTSYEEEKTRNFFDERLKAVEDMIGAAAIQGAQTAGLNTPQIINILNSFGHENIPVKLWEAKLLESATRLTELQEELSRLTNDEPEIAALIKMAEEAIEAGDVEKADAHLAEAVRRDEEAGERRLRRAAENEGRRGDLAHAEGRYIKAADHFARAARLIRPFDPSDWAGLKYNEGNAAYERGNLEADPHNLRRAITAYREALKEWTRERVPLDWAMTQNNLGNALATLGARGDDEALQDAIAAYREALKERTRERAPLDWAMTQNNLGNALLTLGERGDDKALQDAIAAYREALKEWTRERVPLQWAATQNNLGVALRTLGARGDNKALQDAIAAYREALKEWTRERVPLDWAMTQGNLANALETLGDQSETIDHWVTSRNHSLAALEEFTARAPAYEAVARHNLAGVEAKLKAAGWAPPEGWPDGEG